MIYFISGHRDLTWEEFAKWYAPAISRVRSNVCSSDGADRMAQDYLLACSVPPENINVYHMLKAPSQSQYTHYRWLYIRFAEG